MKVMIGGAGSLNIADGRYYTVGTTVTQMTMASA